MSPKFHSCQKVQTRRDKCHPGIWNSTVMTDLGESGDCVDAGSSPKGVASSVRSASCQSLLDATGVNSPLRWSNTRQRGSGTVLQFTEAAAQYPRLTSTLPRSHVDTRQPLASLQTSTTDVLCGREQNDFLNQSKGEICICVG